MTTHHHYPTTPDHVTAALALVSTCREGSPFTTTKRHTVQVGLTPAAAAGLLRVLETHTRLPAECEQLAAGLRSVALTALADS